MQGERLLNGRRSRSKPRTCLPFRAQFPSPTKPRCGARLRKVGQDG
jgi:hypothetical protein